MKARKLGAKKPVDKSLVEAKKTDNISAKGIVTLTIRREDGSIRERVTRNLVVTLGLYHIASLVAGNSPAQMSHMAIGTGTTTQTPGDNQLVAEIEQTGRRPFDSKSQGTGADSNKVIYIATWPSGDGNGEIAEAGIFNAASGGTMLCRTADFGVKSKGTGDSLTLTWKIIFNG